MRAILLVVLCSACSLNVDYKGTNFQCNPDGTCPPGFECLDQVCVAADPVPPACSSAISSGGGHSCAIREDGSVWCWGRNGSGQLGDGSAVDSDLPVQVDNTKLKKATQIGTGDSFSCALDDMGAVWCWGLNGSGQLGDGSSTDNRVPVQVSVSGAIELSVGNSHACVVKSDRTVVCWGENNSGEIGDGSNLDRPVPTAQSPAVDSVRTINAGYESTCAVMMDGSAMCWGDNNEGELGVGDTLPHNKPTAVVAVSNIKQVAGGDNFTCFLTTEGFVHCSGYNNEGQLGNGTNLGSSRPVPVQIAQTLTSIDAGINHICGIDVVGGNTWCWGYGNHGRLLDAELTVRFYPVRGLVPHAVAVSAGHEHTCVLDTDGAVRCAGYNSRGQLGDGRAITSSSPVQVDGVTNAVAVVAGGDHTCAAQADGEVLCWGANDFGQAGNGSFVDDQTVPHAVYGLRDPEAMAAGGLHTCALLADNNVYCWGYNANGRLGDNTQTSSPSPRQVINIDGAATGVSIGEHSSFAMVAGGARCWGAGFSQVPTLKSGLLDITAGNAHVCTVEPDRTVACYGENTAWQLGNGTNIASPDPVPVLNISNAVEVMARFNSTCALIMDGTIQCWGDNGEGKLGPGDGQNPQMMPRPVMGMSSVKKFAMGYSASCAIKMDGTLWCWGANTSGQVGDGSYQARLAPVQLAALTGAKDVASGGTHSCAIDSSGNVQCWGYGGDGQLGNGIRTIVRPVGVRMSCPE